MDLEMIEISVGRFIIHNKVYNIYLKNFNWYEDIKETSS